MKEFTKEFESLAIRHSWYYVFEDFLGMFLNGISFNYATQNERDSWKEKYTKDERIKFGNLIRLAIIEYDKNIETDNCWYDFLGTFYESQSLSKKKGFAQYFTPEHLCSFISQIVAPKAELLSEPACGSGRFILSANALNKQSFVVGQDSDLTVCKMAAINLWIHGIDGMIICINTLSMQDFKRAFIINQWLHLNGLPEVDCVETKQEAYRYQSYRVNRHNQLLEVKRKRIEQITMIKEILLGNIDDVKEEEIKEVVKRDIEKTIQEEKEILENTPVPTKDEIVEIIKNGKQLNLFG